MGLKKNILSKTEDQTMKNDRFEKTYSQGSLNVTEIWVDKATGVNYIYHVCGSPGGLTPLLDREGKPIISPVFNQ